MKPTQFIKPLTPSNAADARIYEPRILFDIVNFDGASELQTGNSDIFSNGERFPLRLTHVLACMLYTDDDEQTPPRGDERLVQRYGLRINAHDEFYMTGEYPILAGWHNVVTAASDIVTQATSVWNFPKPVLMGQRDTFEVEAQLIVAPEEGVERVTVTFMGVGMFSREPKILTGFVELANTLSVNIPATQLQNSGLEPLEIHKLVVNNAPPNESENPTGNIRNVRIRVKQNGSGTNQWWIRGPQVSIPNSRVPAPIAGITAGRCVVHKIPAEGGWLLNSGEGLTIQVRSYVPTRVDSVVIAMAGYVEVT